MTAALQGWHPGETKLQRKLGYAEAVSDRWQYVENSMREQHRTFYTSNLPFIPVTTIDDYGRPWGSIAVGATGEIGFAKSPDNHTLTMGIGLWEGEPLVDTIRRWLETQNAGSTAPERFLTAGIGIEFSTRRRNKFAGLIKNVKRETEWDYKLTFQVTQALGNCPKYINVRKFIPYPHTHPLVAYQDLHMGPSKRLPNEVIEFIINADTVFVASIYKSEASTANRYPSHAGMNSRGGLPGFMRVRPSDGRTVILPDYSGNRFLSSLGNIESTKLAGLTIISFTTGDVLYLTGTAEILIGPPALEIMARQPSIAAIEITGYTFVRDAFPIRQDPRTQVERSPYSPKIKYLLEEPEAKATAASGHQARLIRAVQLAPDIATLRFQVISKPGVEDLKIRPGQAIVLDFMDWIGPPVYQHMANDAPGSINDDRVRTWTVSSAHEDREVTWFELTMREMKGGAVTGALFNTLKEYTSNKWGHSVKIDTIKVIADIVGITGDFFMGEGYVKVLWVAGGIGVTPFMAMLSALLERNGGGQGDVILALATKEPDVFLQLLQSSLCKTSPKLKFRIDLFTNEDIRAVELEKLNVGIVTHKGRIPQEYWGTIGGDRDVFICGPGGFGDAAVNGLRSTGVPMDKIMREGFY